jgi:hypothetical protein
MSWRRGTVERAVRQWAGAVEYAVRLPSPDPAGLAAEVRALAYLDVVGEPHPGDEVLLNVSALVKGLGTGGLAFVVAAPDRLPPDAHGPGHIVKARYTPQQQMFLAIDEQDSPHHAALASAAATTGDLGGLPVVVADLHSALPAVLAGVRTLRPRARIAYVMTDGGALPLAFSRSVAALSEAGWLASTVTVGQAFGGDHEAVTLHSALLAARHVLAADVVVVVQGPGNVGTGTPWGFTGVAAGEALNAVGTLGGRGIAALRVSFGDARPRHRGISHHSLTAYGRVCLVPAQVPCAEPTNAEQALVVTQARELVDTASAPLELVAVDPSGLLEALRSTPVTLSTMGRGLDEDPEAFVAAAVAGRHAATLIPGS